MLEDPHLDPKDRLHDDDIHKYSGTDKFNPKSSKSGTSVGYIDLNTASSEVVFAQIRMLREVMFDVIPMSRYNHLVRNSGSKVWSRRTALMAVLWEKNMECPMSRPGLQGCFCPITQWTNLEMFIAHWQIYHIDQHTSHILCEHMKDGTPCYYMTDHKANMKAHIHKLHKQAVKAKQATNT